MSSVVAPDLLDFFSTHTPKSVVTPASALNTQPSNNTTKQTGGRKTREEEEAFTFDITSHLDGRHEEHSNNYSHAEEEDAWSALAARPTNNTSVSSSLPLSQSTSSQFKLTPDSALWNFSKSLDAFGDRISAGVGEAQVAIDRLDARAGVSRKLQSVDGKWNVSGRLDGLESDLTKSADKMSRQVKIMSERAEHEAEAAINKGVAAVKKKLKNRKDKKDNDSQDPTENRASSRRTSDTPLPPRRKSGSGTAHKFINFDALGQETSESERDDTNEEEEAEQRKNRAKQIAMNASFAAASSATAPSLFTAAPPSASSVSAATSSLHFDLGAISFRSSLPSGLTDESESENEVTEHRTRTHTQHNNTSPAAAADPFNALRQTD